MSNQDPAELLRAWVAAKTGKPKSDLSDTQVAAFADSSLPSVADTKREIQKQLTRTKRFGQLIARNTNAIKKAL